MLSSTVPKPKGPSHQLLLGLMALSCTVVSLAINNPSGNCSASTNGSRIGYSPGPGDTYLPDCKAPLLREYWRVFAKSEGMAYVVPRPDGIAKKYGLCDGSDELATILEKYAMCMETLDRAGVDKINNIQPADALTVTNALHKNLLFKAIEAGDNDNQWGFDPFAIDDDIIAACEHVAESEADHVAKGYCSDVASRCTEPGGACIEIFYFPNKESAQLLAPAINEIYGITSSGVSGPRPLSWGWIFVAVTGLGVLLSRQ